MNDRKRRSALPGLVLACALACALVVVFVGRVSAQDGIQESVPTTVEAIVVEVLEDSERPEIDGTMNPYQRLEMRLIEGPNAQQVVIAEHGLFAQVNTPRYSVGDKLVLSEQPLATGGVTYYVVEPVRRGALLLLACAFVVLTIVVGRWRGAASLVSLAFSFVVIFFFVLPQIVSGSDPIAVTIAAAAMVVPVTFYLSHGINRKTTSAVAGTLIALVITGFVAVLATNAAKLTGYSSEEALFLQTGTAMPFDMRGLLLASIIVGLLGVLDDITVSQAAVVKQLRSSSPDMPRSELFSRAMDVGTDHIASLVNTLVLVYVSASLPLLLLFTSGSQSFAEAVNHEVVAEEIVRMLVASIGLILAVPVTTLVASFYVVGEPVGPDGDSEQVGAEVSPHQH